MSFTVDMGAGLEGFAMILARASQFLATASLFASLIVTADEARADVLELGSDGARWVAGGPVTATARPLPAYERETPVILDAIALPDAITVDPRYHSALVPPRYTAKVAELSQRYNLAPALIEALVWQESRWQENAVSPVGARGLAQLMPGTARYLGVNPDDPMQNLEGGARYLREQLDRFGGDLEKALAAYNAGPGRVIRAGGVPNIAETRHYVAAIMGRLAAHSRPVVSR
jgi:soluble lytic murein transglycosylase-like protein